MPEILYYDPSMSISNFLQTATNTQAMIDANLVNVENNTYSVINFQVDATLDPGATPVTNARFLILDKDNLHVNFGTIVDVGNQDIARFDGVDWVVDFDASLRGSGAGLYRKSSNFHYYFNGSAWVTDDILMGLMLEDGSKAFTAPVAGIDPIADQDLTPKLWVQNQITAAIGEDKHQPPVIDVQVDATLNPGATPATGARFMLNDVLNLHANFGTIVSPVAVGDGDLVEYDGADFLVDFDASAESEGALVRSDNGNIYYDFDGAAWNKLGSVIDHLQLLNRGTIGHAQIDLWLDQNVQAGESPDFDVANMTMAKLGSPTSNTVQYMQDTFHSAGCIEGGTVSDNGDNTIAVTLAQIYIRAADDPISRLYFSVASAVASLSVPVGTTKYVYIKYNGGSPTFDVSASDSFNNNTEFIGAVVTNEGGTIHIAPTPTNVADHAANMIQRMHDVQGIKRNNHLGGNLVSELGTRNVAVTAGELWDRLTNSLQSAFDSSAASTFNRYYRDGASGHTIQLAQTQWNNTQYDDGTGVLATLGVNKWGVQWFYQTLGGDVLSVFGTAEHGSEASAEDEGVPSDVPGRISDMSILIGRLIFQKSDATATSFDSAFDSAFSAALVTDHNATAGLQGGIANEYYHLTSAEHALVPDQSVDIASEPEFAKIGINESSPDVAVHATGAVADATIKLENTTNPNSLYACQNNSSLGIIAINRSPVNGAFTDAAKAAATIILDSQNLDSSIAFGTSAANNANPISRLKITKDGVIDILSGQVKFPATQNPSSDANTLDDWEFGNWSPEIWDTSYTTDGATYTTQDGDYVKRGDWCYCTCVVELLTKGSLSSGSQVFLGGFPFTCDSDSPMTIGSLDDGIITAGYSVTGYTLATVARGLFKYWNAATGTGQLLISHLDTTAKFRISFEYKV